MSTPFDGRGSFEEVYGEGEPMPEPPEPAFFAASEDDFDPDIPEKILEQQRIAELESD